ncbi:MAG TPA: DUF2723 domain-containing protein, partial [Candidatus Udaeobacter sp.]|nr:DUF2723 domain-containing protein [Candidatus Udaeobacter sp.]
MKIEPSNRQTRQSQRSRGIPRPDRNAVVQRPSTAPAYARFAQDDRVVTFYAAAVFLVSLVVYSLTLAPTVTPTDSGELILAAYGLGVAHPPGVPVWIMLAHIASLVPIGNVAARINFSSAVFAALACAMVTLVVAEFLIMASGFAAPRRKNKAARQESNIENPTARLLIFAPAAGAGLLMAFSRTLWAYATITEVYAL